MTNRTSFFDSCAERWDRDESPDIQAKLDRVVSLSGVEPGSSVLDVGTGTGVLIPSLLQRIGIDGRILAIDISSAMLNKTQAKGFPSQASFQLADIQRTGYEGAQFDAVFCNAVFPHFEDKALALRECSRLLKGQGILVISHPIGREAVNRIHAQAGGAVGEDRIPSNAQIQTWLEEAGLSLAEVVDEREFHFIRAVKSDKL